MKHIRKAGKGTLWSHREKKGVYVVLRNEYGFIYFENVLGGRKSLWFQKNSKNNMRGFDGLMWLEFCYYCREHTKSERDRRGKKNSD